MPASRFSPEQWASIVAEANTRDLQTAIANPDELRKLLAFQVELNAHFCRTQQGMVTLEEGCAGDWGMTSPVRIWPSAYTSAPPVSEAHWADVVAKTKDDIDAAIAAGVIHQLLNECVLFNLEQCKKGAFTLTLHEYLAQRPTLVNAMEALHLRNM